jgi:hypothetical protein
MGLDHEAHREGPRRVHGRRHLAQPEPGHLEPDPEGPAHVLKPKVPDHLAGAVPQPDPGVPAVALRRVLPDERAGLPLLAAHRHVEKGEERRVVPDVRRRGSERRQDVQRPRRVGDGRLLGDGTVE